LISVGEEVEERWAMICEEEIDLDEEGELDSMRKEMLTIGHLIKVQFITKSYSYPIN